MAEPEIFFSIIQKKVVSPNDFPSLEQLSETLLAFADRYSATAKPFSWKYTAADLKDLLRHISGHDKQDTMFHAAAPHPRRKLSTPFAVCRAGPALGA